MGPPDLMGPITLSSPGQDKTLGIPPPWPRPETLAVVVCAYTCERWPNIKECLDSLLRQDRPVDEIVLVVDHNRELCEMAEDLFGSAVTVLANCNERGLSGARNTGLVRATSDVVAFVDDDAVPSYSWARSLLASYLPDVAGVGGRAQERWEGARPRWFPPEFSWVVGCSWTGLPEHGPGDVRNLIGANMSLRRTALEAAGGFRDGIGRIGGHLVGCEETELCIRVRQLWPAARFVYDPSVTVEHAVPVARERPGYFFRRCLAEGQSKALVARAVGPADGLASERLHVLSVLPRGFAEGVRAGFRGDPGGFARSGAIISGLAVTVAGYVHGRLAPTELAPLPLSARADGTCKSTSGSAAARAVEAD